MGQAKARGSKDQRVAEAVERARVAEIARREQARADRMARAEALEAKQAERDKELEMEAEQLRKCAFGSARAQSGRF